MDVECGRITLTEDQIIGRFNKPVPHECLFYDSVQSIDSDIVHCFNRCVPRMEASDIPMVQTPRGGNTGYAERQQAIGTRHARKDLRENGTGRDAMPQLNIVRGSGRITLKFWAFGNSADGANKLKKMRPLLFFLFNSHPELSGLVRCSCMQPAL